MTYSCPAVSQSCSRTVRSSRYMVLDRKSIPIVACGVWACVCVRRGQDRSVAPRDDLGLWWPHHRGDDGQGRTW